jgi:HSP20 family protein
MDHLFDDFFRTDRAAGSSRAFAPRVNVAETESGYEVSIDLPGMKPEEFEVELKDNHLWITGERKHESEEDGKTFHRIERRHGRFRRVVPLDAPIKAEAVEAEYRDGVLRINVPKTEEVRPKRIEVKS